MEKKYIGNHTFLNEVESYAANECHAVRTYGAYYEWLEIRINNGTAKDETKNRFEIATKVLQAFLGHRRQGNPRPFRDIRDEIDPTHKGH